MKDSHSPEMQAIFDELGVGEPFATLKDAQREMERRMRAYNARAQADLGGLSPTQMYSLLYGDWVTTGALRLNEQLSLDDLADAAILADARMFLEYVRDHAPVKETAARYLPPAVVAELLESLRMPTLAYLSRNHVFSPPKREAEVPWLPELRFVLTIAKLILKRNGLRVTAAGRSLLAPQRAGELYALLFRTFFRRLELSCLDGASENLGLQKTLSFSLHALRTQGRDWTLATQLSKTAWLESAKDPPTARELEYGDFNYIAFQHRLLDPLVQFGLLEARERAGDRLGDRIEYRCTSLYGRFLRFEL